MIDIPDWVGASYKLLCQGEPRHPGGHQAESYREEHLKGEQHREKHRE